MSSGEPIWLGPATSELSMHCWVRHLAEVERIWFRRVRLPDPGLAGNWSGHVDGYKDRGLLDDAVWEDDLAA
jgi:hypothetical protein